MDKTYLIQLTIVVERSQYEPYLPAHLDYLRELKQQGLLLLSGPFTDRRGGIVLIRASSLEEAETIAQNDPLVRNRVDTYDIREWLITDGNPELLPIHPLPSSTPT